MLRASLSDCRSRIANDGFRRASVHQRRAGDLLRPRLPTESLRRSHHQFSRQNPPPSLSGGRQLHSLYRRAPSSWSPIEHVSRRHRANASSMSTKPSYDFFEDDDDDDYIDCSNGDDTGHHVRWIDRSSGYDDVSGYDNFHEYEERPSRSAAYADLEGSLLNLLNRPAAQGSRGAKRTGQNRGAYREEESLLQLLNKDADFSQTSQNAGAETQLQHEQSRSKESLLDLLTEAAYDDPSTSIDFGSGGPVQNESQKTADSLLDLLGGAAADFPSPSIDVDGRGQFQHQPLEAVEEEAESLLDLLDEETREAAKGNRYRDLNRLQLQLELESTEEAIDKILEVWNAARERSDHETLPVVRRALDAWYKPLTEAIELEQWLYLNNDFVTCSHGLSQERQETTWEDNGDAESLDEPSTQRYVRDRSRYGPLLCLLPARKIAVILAHAALSFSMVRKDEGAQVVSLAMLIASQVEMEVNVSRALRVRAQQAKLDAKARGMADVSIEGETGSEAIEAENPSANTDVDNWIYTATHLQRFLDELEGGPGKDSLKGQGRVKPHLVKRRCKQILLAEGFVSDATKGKDAPARKLSMNDFAEWDNITKVKLGSALIRLLLDHTTYSAPLDRGHAPPEPAFRWLRKYTGKTKDGRTKLAGFIAIHPHLLDVAVNEQLELSSRLVPPSLTGSRVQPMVVPPKDWTDVDNGGYETIKVAFMRSRHCKSQKDAIRRADLSKAMEGLNVLGKIPWKINQNVLDVALKCWHDGKVLGDIPSQTDHEVPPLPEPLGYRELKTLGDVEKKIGIEELRKHRDALGRHNRYKQRNMDLHSLRCSAVLKLNQAQKFRNFEEIYFPYNVDFRGRAYPVPPHLSIVGSDLCRGLLMFAHPKPLGSNGLYWLKVHLANLAGADKMSFDERAQFAEENMDNIRAAVDDPFGDNDWWTKFDDPFQGLATCHEIVQAVDSGDPENYPCSLPVHMDGSCNGLQHYAALGRDREGGRAVNLCVADEPQDVYIGVMNEVIRRVAQDAEQTVPYDESDNDLTQNEKDTLKKIKSARLVNGLIDRGVVKRTVMTSVYGVTYIGAKNQISEKIEEKLEEKGFDIDEIEPQIHTACGYLAGLTMEVMGQQFKGARQTMDWLRACARLIGSQGQPVSFVSPIGVPVVQPYRQRRSFAVVTLLQSIHLTNDSDVLPLHRQRQVSAFPPNYVHSLDSSHMILTAIEMQKRGLHFSAVHDSYWTHPCDVEEMNTVLREAFIDLYNRPLLEELKKLWELRYPSLDFPDLPAQGDLDLDEVRSAPYFFQ